MIRIFSYIILFGLTGFACNGIDETHADSNELNDDFNKKSTERVYVNEFGQVTVVEINDTLWKVNFENNDGFIFDTTMVVKEKDTSNIYHELGLSTEEFYLAYGYGGLSINKDQIMTLEFSGMANLQMNTKIENLYNRNFFRTDKEIEISGDLTSSKAGVRLNDIYLMDENKIYDDGYYTLNGKIRKESYPKSFYSTDESPQGMFPDDGKTRYRLVSRKFELQQPMDETYTGYPVNLDNGKAAIAWELADSEAYILEGHKAWTKDELNKEITVEGYLVQNHKGSFLKNWKIVDGH